MAEYLGISAPKQRRWLVPAGGWGAVGRDAHAAIDEAKVRRCLRLRRRNRRSRTAQYSSLLIGAACLGRLSLESATLDGGFTVLELHLAR